MWPPIVHIYAAYNIVLCVEQVHRSANGGAACQRGLERAEVDAEPSADADEHSKELGAVGRSELGAGEIHQARAVPSPQFSSYEPGIAAQGNITAIARDSSGAALATHTVFTSGPAAGIVLSLDAPSISTGTGAALLLDGQDAGLVRATIVPTPPNIISCASGAVQCWNPVLLL
jgi:hypothetical protein